MNRLFLRKEGKSQRQSSWDRTGGNKDRITIEAGSTAVIVEMEGSGIIQHIWMTIAAKESIFVPQGADSDVLGSRE
jgi:hypothetical protein